MTAADHANTIREAIEEAQGADFDAGHGPEFTRDLYAQRLAALDALLAQAEAAEEVWTHEDRMVLGEGGC